MTAHVTTELNSALNVGTVENKYWGKRQEILYRWPGKYRLENLKSTEILAWVVTQVLQTTRGGSTREEPEWVSLGKPCFTSLSERIQIGARTSACCPFVKKLHWNVRIHSRVPCCCVCDTKAELRVERLPSPSQTSLPAPSLDDRKFLVPSLSLKTRLSSRT